MKTQAPVTRAGIENLGLKNDFRWKYPHPSDFRGPPILKIFFLHQGYYLVVFRVFDHFELKFEILMACV